jgi:hypothetical protein
MKTTLFLFQVARMALLGVQRAIRWHSGLDNICHGLQNDQRK